MRKIGKSKKQKKKNVSFYSFLYKNNWNENLKIKERKACVVLSL